VRGFVDVHSHVVPSGDDGAASIAEGLGLCRIALDDGIRILFATPHAHAPWDTYPRTAYRIDLFEASFPVLRDEVAAWGLDLRRGWEVYPTELLHSDPAEFVLEGTRGVLIEFPGSWLEIEDPLAVVAEAALIVEEAGLVPVLAHPERCRAVAHDPGSIRPFVERGWLVCLNAPSLVGRHGGTAERTAWRLLDEGLAGLAASDGHSVSRPPTLGEGFRAVRDQFGEDYALSLFDGSALPWIELQPSE
jgi:protein-tyrosine phosphatase